MTPAGARTLAIFVVDDDRDLACSLVRFLKRAGHEARAFDDPEQLLAVYSVQGAACVISDIMMRELDGFAFADRLRALDPAVAILFMTAWPTVSAAVDAVRFHGGIDYLAKPLNERRLLRSLEEGLKWSSRKRDALLRLQALTAREREIFALLVQGHSSKAVANFLGISARTVEDHRARITSKTGAVNMAQLIALAGGE
nr:response regulator [uncultured Sphingomonas sp.]